MNRKIRRPSGLLLAGCLAGVLAAPATTLANPIEERQAMMEDTKNALGPLMDMNRGKRDFDATTVTESLAVFERVAGSYGELFPPGSETGNDTEARPEIWTDRAGFDQRLVDFGEAVGKAQAANPQNVDELKPVLFGILNTCKGCHDNYRVDKD
jgi:cytochrome c556